MKPIHKLNGGNGATLCHKCRKIISEGMTEDLYCENCKPMGGYIGDEGSIEKRAKLMFNSHYYIIQDDEKAKKCANSSIDHILNTVGYLVDSNEFIRHFTYWEKVRKIIDRL